MLRRDFITLLGGAAACPMVAQAQQRATLPVVGFLNGASASGYANMAAAFRKGLGEVGYVEGANVNIEYRWADGQSDRLPALAEELVRRNVTVIVATAGGAPALAAKAATTTIPVVFAIGGDPVKLGLVEALNRPGGNVTGVTILTEELAQKRLQVLHDAVPAARTLGVLINPNGLGIDQLLPDMEMAARTLGIQIQIANAGTEAEFEAAFSGLVRSGVGGLLIITSALYTSQVHQFAALSVRNALPAIYGIREFAAAGGLMSYGGSIADQYRLVGVYTGRVLKGEKPMDLPIQQATKIDLVINLKTAKALGLNISQDMLSIADEVIE
jgi:putative ABC transport system substrate-binding protein